jgi:hypothetical protein
MKPRDEVKTNSKNFDFNEEIRAEKFQLLKSIAARINSTYSKLRGEGIPSNVEILSKFLTEPDVSKQIYDNKIPSPETDIYFERLKILINKIPESSWGRTAETSALYKKLKEDISKLPNTNLNKERKQFILKLKEELEKPFLNPKKENSFSSSKIPAHLNAMKAKIADIFIGTNDTDVNTAYQAIKKLMEKLPKTNKAVSSRDKAADDLYEKILQETDGVPGQTYKHDKLAYLINLRDELNDSHKEWDNKARSLFGRQAPSNIKKLRKALANIGEKSSMAEVIAAFDLSKKTLHTAVNNKSSTRHPDVHNFYQAHLYNIEFVDYQAQTGAGLRKYTLLKVEQDPKDFLLAMRAELAKKEWDNAGEKLVGKKAPETIKKLRAELGKVEKHSHPNIIKTVFASVKNILQTAVSSKSKHRNNKVHNTYVSHLETIEKIEKFQREEASRRVERAEEARAEATPKTPFLGDLSDIHSSAPEVKTAEEKNPKEYLLALKYNLADKKWNSLGTGIVNSTPANISKMRGILEKVTQKTTDKNIQEAFISIHAILKDAYTNESKDRHADVKKLYRGNYLEATKIGRSLNILPKETPKATTAAPDTNDKKAYLLALKEEVHKAEWNKKGGRVIKSAPANFEKLRTLLTKLTETSGMDAAGKIFDDVRANLIKAAGQQSSSRDEDVQKFYDNHLKKANELHAKSSATLEPSELVREYSRSATEGYTRLAEEPESPASRASVSSAASFSSETETEVEEFKEEAESKFENSLHTTQSLDSDAEASRNSNPFDDSDQSEEETFKEELKRPLLVEVREGLHSAANPFADAEEPEDQKEEIFISKDEVKKRFLTELKKELKNSKWKDKGEGLFGQKLPATIRDMQVALVEIKKSSAPLAIDKAIKKVEKLLKAALENPSPDRHKTVKHLYEATFATLKQISKIQEPKAAPEQRSAPRPGRNPH